MSCQRTYPIILAHGIARFDAAWNDLFHLDNQDNPFLDSFHYFRGIRTMLMEQGFDVTHSSVPWAECVDRRAEQLTKNVRSVLERPDVEKVNIIAHSMGGLDARHMLFNDREKGKIHERVASLTTIGTPHLGTSFADFGIQQHGEIIGLLKRLSLDVEGFRDLTRDACAKFNKNREVMDFEAEIQKSIRLLAYTGVAKRSNVLLVLKKPYEIIAEQEGDNDGLVSVKSALWERAGEQGTWMDTDHLNELAWWDLEQAGMEGILALTRRIHNEYLGIAKRLPGGPLT